jgi:hypothetical protein
MNPCAVGIRAQSSLSAYSVARSVSGGGTATIAGGCHAPMLWGGVVLQSGVSPRGWRPLSNLDVRNGCGLPVPLPLRTGTFYKAGLVPTSEVTMTLVELFTAAILTLAPSMQPATATRYATDIENAVDAELELGMALVVTMNAEAKARPEEIERCIYKPWEGDRDARGKPRALGLYQLHHYWWDGFSPEEICGSHTLQAILAAKEMRHHLTMTRGNMHRALRRHVGIGIDPKDPRVVNRPRNYDRVVANARKALQS